MDERDNDITDEELAKLRRIIEQLYGPLPRSEDTDRLLRVLAPLLIDITERGFAGNAPFFLEKPSPDDVEVRQTNEQRFVRIPASLFDRDEALEADVMKKARSSGTHFTFDELPPFDADAFMKVLSVGTPRRLGEVDAATKLDWQEGKTRRPLGKTDGSDE